MHFRNVTRIMDCVGCDKCRLWGKVQTTGVATALKILFELDEKALEYVLLFPVPFPSNTVSPISPVPDNNLRFLLISPHANANLLQRTEVVALINTLHRFSESLAAVEEFRRLWREASAADSEKLIRDAEDAAKRVRSPTPTPSLCIPTTQLYYVLN